MTGIIVTGHGQFARGLVSGLEMIAGTYDLLQAVPFLEADDSQELLRTFSRLYEEMDGDVLVLADLAGGSPFQMAVLASRPWADVEVIGGANQPMLLEAVMSRQVMDVHELAKMLVDTGKSGVARFPK